MKTLAVLTFLLASNLCLVAGQASSTTPTIPLEVLKRALERAKDEVGPVNREFNLAGEYTSGSTPILQDPTEHSSILAGTQVIPSTGPGTTAFTNRITLYPARVAKRFPDTKDNNELLEEVLYLILCHELEHMPENTGPGGYTPAHPADSGGDQSDANKCASIRQYQRDCTRACNAADRNMANANLPLKDRCALVAQDCKFHSKISKLANTPLYVAAAANCVPPIAVSNGEVVTRCALCDSLECPSVDRAF